MITISNLTSKYDDKVVLSIEHLSIEEKEKICLIGNSGSGKSTLFECLYGLKSYEGSINLKNKDEISYAPQSLDIIDNFSVKTNILMGRFGNKGIIKNLRSIFKENEEVNCILERLNISKYKSKQVAQLSGGEKQRVLIARTLYEDKSIYLLDEPTSALDVYNSKNTMNLIMESKENKTVICAIHDLQLVDFFTRVIVLSNGKIILDEKVKNISKERLEDYFDNKKNKI